MDFFIIPRRMARLQYLTARLPFTIFDKYVVARYLDDQALPRRSFELFLGSMDEIARCLLADGHISRRDDAMMRRPESPAAASGLETNVQARWAQHEENLQAAASQAGEQAHEGINIAAAYQQEQEDNQQARRKAEAQAEAEEAPAEHAAGTPAAETEQAPQAAQMPIPAGQDQAGAAASRQVPDAAGKRRLVRYRPEEAGSPGQLAASEHDTT